LGALGGIMICDCYLIRKTNLNVVAMFDPKGIYRGWNFPAWISLCLSMIPVIPGFLIEIGILPSSTPTFWSMLYSYAWFITFLLAFGCYGLLAKLKCYWTMEKDTSAELVNTR
jgi:NCS1 family nucleobase:cation symporter-1